MEKRKNKLSMVIFMSFSRRWSAIGVAWAILTRENKHLLGKSHLISSKVSAFNFESKSKVKSNSFN